MSTIVEIEEAIEKLPPPQVDELAGWFEKFRSHRMQPPDVEMWLSKATGASRQGLSTADILTLTRGE